MAGGYTHSDAEAEHALILNENAVYAVKQVLARQQSRTSALRCVNPECDVDIPEARRKAVPGCQHCVECAPKFSAKPQRVKMLDHIL